MTLPIREDPDNAGTSRAACVKCGLWTTCVSPFMQAYIPTGWTGKLLVVGEAPGKNEDKSGRPFVGDAGNVLFQFLEGVGFERRDIALTNAARCRPERNATPSLTQIRLCRPFVVNDVVSLRPKWVLCVGDAAASSILNAKGSLKRLRQRAFDGAEFFGEDARGINVAFTYHPASTMYAQGAEMKEKIREDLRWLVNFRGYQPGPDTDKPLGGDQFAFDIEWDRDYHLLTLSVADPTSSCVTENPIAMRTWWREYFAKDIRCVNHNVIGDLIVLRLNGFPVPREYISGEKLRDTMLTSRLANENLGAYGLEDVGAMLAGVSPWKRNTDKLSKNAAEWPEDLRQERCRLDSWTALKVLEATENKSDYNVQEFSHRLACCLRRVELAGARIDRTEYERLRDTISSLLDERKSVLAGLATKYGMEDFSASNDDDFRALLFDRIGAEPSKFTAKDHKPAVGKDPLTLIYQRGIPEQQEAILARLRYEKAEKLFSTYIGKEESDNEDATGLQKFLTPGFFVFQSINPLGARTGRRSSSRPNMQNWPGKMRSLVVSRFPAGKIVEGDESQLEPRIMAHVAGIPEWQEIFDSGKNFYVTCAKHMWNQDVDKKSTLYKITKSTILGTNYGMEWELFQERMSTQSGIDLTEEEAKLVLKKYHTTFPQVPRYFEIQKERLLRNQAVATMTGQVRHLPCPEGVKTKGFKHLWNQAVNFPIQGTAAYVTGSAVLDLEAALLEHFGITLEEHYDNLVGWYGKEKLNFSLDKSEKCGTMVVGRELDYPVIINEVHDSIIVDTPAEFEGLVIDMLTEIMSTCPTLRRYWPETKVLPLKAEIVSGNSWAKPE